MQSVFKVSLLWYIISLTLIHLLFVMNNIVRISVTVLFGILCAACVMRIDGGIVFCWMLSVKMREHTAFSSAVHLFLAILHHCLPEIEQLRHLTL